METMMIIFVMAILVITFATMPFFSKKGIHFGIRISHIDISKLKRIYTQFIIWTTVFGVIGSYIILIVPNQLIGIISVTFAYLVVAGFAYIRAYQQVKGLKSEMIEENAYTGKAGVTVIDTTFTKEKGRKMMVSPWYFLIPIGITLLVGVMSVVNYDKIPDPMPIHYSATGEVDGWAKKTYGTALMLPMVSLAMTGLFYVIYRIIGKSKQQISAKNPCVSSKQNRKHRKLWSGYTVGSAILTTLLFGYIQLILLKQPVEKVGEMMFITLGFTLLAIIATLGIALYTGSSGSKLKIEGEDIEDFGQEESDDDKYWKWGSIYYNPDDPSVFVEKRVGIGWTVNMGALKGKLLIVGTLILTVVAIVMGIVYS